MSNRFERAADKKQVERFQKILYDLQNQPENKKCADCKGRDPRWASANLGIFICLRCSGIHRSLGTHISKVRSIDMDTWVPEHIENMQRWGNARANKYWENKLGPNHIPDDSNIQSFIRSKYEGRKFALSPDIPEPETLDMSDSPPPSVSSGTSNAKTSGNTAEKQFDMTSIFAANAKSPTSSSKDSISKPQSLESFGNPNNNNSNNNGGGKANWTTDFVEASADRSKSVADDVFGIQFPNSKSDVKSNIMSLYPSPQQQGASNAFYQAQQMGGSFANFGQQQPQSAMLAQPQQQTANYGQPISGGFPAQNNQGYRVQPQSSAYFQQQPQQDFGSNQYGGFPNSVSSSNIQFSMGVPQNQVQSNNQFPMGVPQQQVQSNNQFPMGLPQQQPYNQFPMGVPQQFQQSNNQFPMSAPQQQQQQPNIQFPMGITHQHQVQPNNQFPMGVPQQRQQISDPFYGTSQKLNSPPSQSAFPQSPMLSPQQTSQYGSPYQNHRQSRLPTTTSFNNPFTSSENNDSRKTSVPVGNLQPFAQPAFNQNNPGLNNFGVISNPNSSAVFPPPQTSPQPQFSAFQAAPPPPMLNIGKSRKSPVSTFNDSPFG